MDNVDSIILSHVVSPNGGNLPQGGACHFKTGVSIVLSYRVPEVPDIPSLLVIPLSPIHFLPLSPRGATAPLTSQHSCHPFPTSALFHRLHCPPYLL